MALLISYYIRDLVSIQVEKKIFFAYNHSSPILKLYSITVALLVRGPPSWVCLVKILKVAK